MTQISVSRYRTACFIRLQLEIGAVRAAACAAPPLDGIGDLEANLEQQSEALAKDDHARLFELDEEFHRQLFVLAGLEDAWATARSTQFDVNRARHIRRLYRILQGPALLTEHAAIVEAIRARDPSRAEAALRAHIGNLDQQIDLLFKDSRLFGFIDTAQAPLGPLPSGHTLRGGTTA
ncbi:GntR family transcriptional regulator [Aliiruegeria sabulilitoris]|uniref:GntR family transcriptional regulator n=1 Tax=Aliiruegeria sabulilitoris TaxID=1510458 RepID=UPI001E642C35|nr:FCD domain-containing protein [Aliiruegeria sabulilitoris]